MAVSDWLSARREAGAASRSRSSLFAAAAAGVFVHLGGRGVVCKAFGKHEHNKKLSGVTLKPEKWYWLQRGPLCKAWVYEGKPLEVLGFQLSVSLQRFFFPTLCF